MKKFLTALLALVMVLSLAACGGKSTGQPAGSGPSGSEPKPSESQAPETKPPETKPEETVPPETQPAETQPPETEPPETVPPETEPPKTEPPETEPPKTEPPVTEPEETEPQGSTPGLVGPGFQFGPGGIITPGGQGGDEPEEEIPVADAGDLVDKLDALCADNVDGMKVSTGSLNSSAIFANYFGHKVQYVEGMRVAVNSPDIMTKMHVVLLIEPTSDMNINEFATLLEENANLRWATCSAADVCKVAVKDGLILVVMSTEEVADAIVAAFNG